MGVVACGQYADGFAIQLLITQWIPYGVLTEIESFRIWYS